MRHIVKRGCDVESQKTRWRVWVRLYSSHVSSSLLYQWKTSVWGHQTLSTMTKALIRQPKKDTARYGYGPDSNLRSKGTAQALTFTEILSQFRLVQVRDQISRSWWTCTYSPHVSGANVMGSLILSSERRRADVDTSHAIDSPASGHSVCLHPALWIQIFGTFTWSNIQFLWRHFHAPFFPPFDNDVSSFALPETYLRIRFIFANHNLDSEWMSCAEHIGYD